MTTETDEIECLTFNQTNITKNKRLKTQQQRDFENEYGIDWLIQ